MSTRWIDDPQLAFAATLLLTFPAVSPEVMARCMALVPSMGERVGSGPAGAAVMLGRVVTNATKLNVLRRVGVEIDGVDLALSLVEEELGMANRAT